MYETAAFFDVLGWANQEGSHPVSVVTCGREREVRCSFGLRVLVDLLVDEVDVDDYAALALPGGFEEHGFYDDAYSPPVAELIRAFDRRSRPIASICVGALPVASCGALQGRRATTYHLGGGRRRRQLAELGAEVVDAPVVRDGHVMTSTSPATAVEVALELLKDLTGAENADRVRELMGFGGG